MEVRIKPAIEIAGITKTYKSKGKGTITAVDQLDLSIQPGQVFGFLGANGAGKTTTIKMICGLIKPTAGTIALNGFDIKKDRSHAVRQIGAVLEGTRNVYWRLSALENVLYFGRMKGVHGQELKQRAEQLLTELNLWERRNDKIRSFSRGMQQKVAIACALINDPPIILLDEPTLGLDVQAAQTVKQWITRLSKEQHKTIILTTHQLDMAQQLCNRVAIINRGKLITNRPTTELLDLFRSEFYEIRIKGQLNGHTQHIVDQFKVTQDNDQTILAGTIDNLYETIDNLRSMNLSLIAVTPIEPNLEEIFMSYLNGEDDAS